MISYLTLMISYLTFNDKEDLAWNNTKDLGSIEYPFRAITRQSTLIWSSSTWGIYVV